MKEDAIYLHKNKGKDFCYHLIIIKKKIYFIFLWPEFLAGPKARVLFA